MKWPTDKEKLFIVGCSLVNEFCAINKIEKPEITKADKDSWRVVPCAYYRPDTPENKSWTKPGIHICLVRCASPCADSNSRNWSWPGSTADREPCGVLAHELGHHCDWLTGEKKGTYWSNYGIDLRVATNEEPISGYCDNDWEWFAEIFRVFIVNPQLLKALRPKTHKLLRDQWTPVVKTPWDKTLGDNVPSRVLTSLANKIEKIAKKKG